MRTAMTQDGQTTPFHSHVFLGEGHEKSERKTWAVIWLCGAIMVAEIVGGLLFGSIALVADGMHMSTHAGALLLTALAYTYARNHADDPDFSFGGEARRPCRLHQRRHPRDDRDIDWLRSRQPPFRSSPHPLFRGIPIACLGLAVNVASAWLLGAGGHHHDHGHGHSHHGMRTSLLKCCFPIEPNMLAHIPRT